MNNFWTRLFTGAVFTGALIIAIALSGWYLHAVMGILAILTLQEFYQLFRKSKSSPDYLSGPIIGAIIYLFLIVDLANPNPEHTLSSSTLWVIILAFPIISFAELYRKKDTPFENIALTVTGLIYILLPFYLLNLMAVNPETGLVIEPWPVLAIFLIVWSNDTFAYLIGKQWGKTKLFERISPKKSWEGFFGGLIFAQICAFIIAWFLQRNFIEYAVYAACITAIGTIGDLVESLLKRSLSVKDSGKILPGHGGLLDRMDAIIFTVPVIYLLHTTVFSS